jgi:hypothetical protein
MLYHCLYVPELLEAAVTASQLHPALTWAVLLPPTDGYPTPHMASSAAWCCSTCCCCSQGDTMTTHDASMPAEQLQPVLQLHQHIQRGWPPAATASALCFMLSPLALPHSLNSFHPSDACSIACGPASHAHASLSALVLRRAPDGGQSQRARMAKGLHRKQIDTIE